MINYSYHHIIIQENKGFYRDLNGTVAKEISCSGKYVNLGNSLTPQIGDTYNYVIRKHYDFDNYLINISKNENPNWENIQNCEWSIIDKIPENIIQKKNIIYNDFYLGGIIFILIIIGCIIFKYYKKKKK